MQSLHFGMHIHNQVSFNMVARIIRHTLAHLLLCVLLVGCVSAPTVPVRINGRNAATVHASWTRLVATLTVEQRRSLDDAIDAIESDWMSRNSHPSEKPAETSGRVIRTFHLKEFPSKPGSFVPDTLGVELDGKSYDDIIALALQLKRRSSDGRTSDL